MVQKVLIAILLACANFLQADSVIKYNIDGEIMEFYYKNSNNSKMLTDSKDGKVEIYHKDKNAFIVTHAQDGVTVVDLNKIKAQAKAMGFDASMYNQSSKKSEFKIKKTKQREKIAGINGEVWILKGKEDGQEYEQKVVVTKNTKVVDTMRAMFKSIADMSNGMSADENFFEPDKGYVVIKADGMVLTSFADKKVASSTYELPKVTNNKEAFQKRTSASKQESYSELDEESQDDMDEAIDMLKSFF